MKSKLFCFLLVSVLISVKDNIESLSLIKTTLCLLFASNVKLTP